LREENGHGGGWNVKDKFARLNPDEFQVGQTPKGRGGPGKEEGGGKNQNRQTASLPPGAGGVKKKKKRGYSIPVKRGER